MLFSNHIIFSTGAMRSSLCIKSLDIIQTLLFNKLTHNIFISVTFQIHYNPMTTHLHLIRWEEKLKLTSKQSIWVMTAEYLAYVYIMTSLSLMLFICPDSLHHWDPLWLLWWGGSGLFQSSRVMWAIIFISLRSDFHLLNDQFEQVMLFLQHTGHRFQPEGKSMVKCRSYSILCIW